MAPMSLISLLLLCFVQAAFCSSSGNEPPSVQSRLSRTRTLSQPFINAHGAARRAAAVADDASSRLITAGFYPGTTMPRVVMQYLIEERHGVNYHLSMPIRENMQQHVLDKLHESLHDPRMSVSSLTYEGTTYFLAPALSFSNSRYARWSQYLREPAGMTSNEVFPMFVAKLVPRRSGRTPLTNSRGYEVLAIRTTATAQDRNQFLRTFSDRNNRHLVPFRELLNGVRRRW